jgi:hypothetical protein
LAVVLPVLEATPITSAPHFAITPEERLNALLHPRISQFGNITNAWQVANAIAANLQCKRVATDIEKAHAPGNGDKATVGRNNGVLETSVIGKHKIPKCSVTDTPLQQNIRADDQAPLQEAVVITARVWCVRSIRTELAVGSNLARRQAVGRPRWTDNLAERALRCRVSDADK